MSCRQRRQAESSIGVANIPAKAEGLGQNFVASPRLATCTPLAMSAPGRGFTSPCPRTGKLRHNVTARVRRHRRLDFSGLLGPAAAGEIDRDRQHQSERP
jgi:hypothetical protein